MPARGPEPRGPGSSAGSSCGATAGCEARCDKCCRGRGWRISRRDEFLRTRAELGREQEERGGPLLVPEHGPDLVDNLGVPVFDQVGTRETDGHERRRIPIEELGDLRHAVADQIVQQRPREVADPVFRVTEDRPAVGRVIVGVALSAIDVNRPSAQESSSTSWRIRKASGLNWRL